MTHYDSLINPLSTGRTLGRQFEGFPADFDHEYRRAIY